MKVNSGQRLGNVAPIRSDVKSSSAKKASAQSGDRVDLSGRNGEVSTLKAMAAQGADVSVDKVPELRQMIDNGTYQVAAKDVAMKMLDYWKDYHIS